MMDREALARAFNEWMRRFTEDAGRFETVFDTVDRYLAETAGGNPPTYGETCVAYLESLASARSGTDRMAVPPRPGSGT